MTMALENDNSYGCKGCTCWVDDVPAYGVEGEKWMPNASCRFHGVLADYQPPRMDTGIYTLDLAAYERDGVHLTPEMHEYRNETGEPEPVTGWVDPQGNDASEGPPCPPGVHSIFDPCPGGCLLDLGPSDDDDEWEWGPDGTPVDTRPALLSTGCVECECGWYLNHDTDSFAAAIAALSEHIRGWHVTEQKETGVRAAVQRWARRLGDWLDPHAAARRELRAHLDGRQPGDQGRER
jgi:hypothetical protein